MTAARCDGRGRLLCEPCEGGGRIYSEAGNAYSCLACKGTGRSGPCDCEACKKWAAAKNGNGGSSQGRMF